MKQFYEPTNYRNEGRHRPSPKRAQTQGAATPGRGHSPTPRTPRPHLHPSQSQPFVSNLRATLTREGKDSISLFCLLTTLSGTWIRAQSTGPDWFLRKVMKFVKLITRICKCKVLCFFTLQGPFKKWIGVKRVRNAQSQIAQNSGVIQTHFIGAVNFNLVAYSEDNKVIQQLF